MLKPDFSNDNSLLDDFWYSMSDAGMSLPVTLNDADLSIPFVYFRKYGVFYVSPENHHHAMALLLAWEMDCYDYLDIDNESIGIQDFFSCDVHSFSDYFLEHFKGTCYMSSVNNKIRAFSSKNLNSMEIDTFYPIVYR